MDEEEKAVIAAHKPYIGVEFGYTAKLWQNFNQGLGVRTGQRVQTSGIQLASNNMPQGETIQIPLKRNIGRQNQIHFLFHFDNYSPDMGRKGFHRELTDFAKEVSRKITELQLAKIRARLKANTGVAPDLLREHEIQTWKAEMEEHEKTAPLAITNKNFFLPISRISIVSVPSREQDVIALFHQVIAGGIIRGIKVMATNERLTYDGLFRISFDLEISQYLYDEQKNPLGLVLDGDAIKKLQGIQIFLRWTCRRYRQRRQKCEGYQSDSRLGNWKFVQRTIRDYDSFSLREHRSTTVSWGNSSLKRP